MAAGGRALPGVASGLAISVVCAPLVAVSAPEPDRPLVVLGDDAAGPDQASASALYARPGSPWSRASASIAFSGPRASPRVAPGCARSPRMIPSTTFQTRGGRASAKARRG